jgi:hypothetical protein
VPRCPNILSSGVGEPPVGVAACIIVACGSRASIHSSLVCNSAVWLKHSTSIPALQRFLPVDCTAGAHCHHPHHPHQRHYRHLRNHRHRRDLGEGRWSRKRRRQSLRRGQRGMDSRATWVQLCDAVGRRVGADLDLSCLLRHFLLYCTLEPGNTACSVGETREPDRVCDEQLLIYPPCGATAAAAAAARRDDISQHFGANDSMH